MCINWELNLFLNIRVLSPLNTCVSDVENADEVEIFETFNNISTGVGCLAYNFAKLHSLFEWLPLESRYRMNVEDMSERETKSPCKHGNQIIYFVDFVWRSRQIKSNNPSDGF